jgi:hypothetical protein
MAILIRILGAIAIACLAFGCVPTVEGEYIPLPVGGGNGGGSAPGQPAQPAPKPVPSPVVPPIQPTIQPTIAPTLMPIAEDELNIPGVRETHAVATKEDCGAMAKRFAQQGRNLKLVRVKANGGTVLPYTCIFEGLDAASGVFDDNRSR